LSLLGNLKSLFCKNENKSWMVEAKYFFKIKNVSVELVPTSPLPLTGLCRGWGSSGSFQPHAVALVMAMKQWGLGLNLQCVPKNCLMCKFGCSSCEFCCKVIKSHIRFLPTQKRKEKNELSKTDNCQSD
jgi:hypothetical protein